MTGLLLATLLNLSPGIQLADTVGGRNVALSEARLPLQRVGYEERPSIDAMTREQLALELRRLDETRPSLVGPIVLLSVGGALAIPGALILLQGVGMLGGSGAAALVGYVIAFVGIVFITVGAILAIVGGIRLAMRIGARGAYAEETDEIRNRIDAIDQEVPPLPPAPPQANRVVPGRLQTVFTF